jgi:hypothetical protein
MLIYDDEFNWQGFGGKLGLAAGKCRLRLYDLRTGPKTKTAHLRPIIVIASDLPESRISVRSVSGHVATLVARKFSIDPHRMLFIEYYPEVVYGKNNEHCIAEHYDAVEYVWREGKAMQPRWRTLKPPVLDQIRNLVKGDVSGSGKHLDRSGR